ncbi:MAG: mismatch-specific DNA-glycosylase [Anaerolineae bacterium]
MPDSIRTLRDHLVPDLDIVFVGLNPSVYSAQKQHYFARRGNLFWMAVNQSGLVPEPLSPQDDVRLPEFKLGLTDLVKRPTPNIDSVSNAEFVKGGKRLKANLLRLEPRIICFVGLTGYRKAFNRRAKVGAQAERWGKSYLFILPSTSRRNASYNRETVFEWFRRLREFRDEVKRDPWPVGSGQ